MNRFGQFVGGVVHDAVDAVRAWSWSRRLVVAAGVLAFIAITALIDIPSIGTLREWATAAGPVFMVLFWLAYVAVTQFPVPRTLLTLASGVLYGPLLGIFLAISATTAAAALSLVIVRRLLGEWMRPRLNHPAVATINRRLEQRGWLAVTSLRMIAGVPFSVLNYAAALTSVPLWAFTIATLVGSLPGTVVTVVLGDALTGHVDPLMVIITLTLAGIGFLGLAVDHRLPVKPVT